VGEGQRLVIPAWIWDALTLLLGALTVYSVVRGVTVTTIEEFATLMDTRLQAMNETQIGIRTVLERIERVLLERLPPPPAR
jgi:hypothetical protein